MPVVRGIAFNDKIITKTWVCCFRPVGHKQLSMPVSLKRNYCSCREGITVKISMSTAPRGGVPEAAVMSAKAKAKQINGCLHISP